jgi:aspartokinase-like uncharacterized kinase
VSNQLERELIVVKVGGSLYDYPELRSRLNCFLESIKPAQIALFPGGGTFTDAVRLVDKVHGLGEEASHWLAVQGLSLAAFFLTRLLGSSAEIVSALPQCHTLWMAGKIAVIDPESLARDDARREDALPRTWDVTSDSLALRLAQRWHANRLILLKSTEAGTENRLEGIVDPCFERLLRDQPVGVEIVNLRKYQRPIV